MTKYIGIGLGGAYIDENFEMVKDLMLDELEDGIALNLTEATSVTIYKIEEEIEVPRIVDDD